MDGMTIQYIAEIHTAMHNIDMALTLIAVSVTARTIFELFRER